MAGRTVVVGGGILGSCAAYFLRERADGGEVIVLEPDPTYEFATTPRSASAIRTQFTLAINVRMSLFGAEFLERMRVLPDNALSRVYRGYLLLATAAGEAVLRQNVEMQRGEGAELAWFGANALAERFPWLNCEDLVAGSLGMKHEGWFDAYALLRLVRAEAIRRGARYVKDAATGFDVAGGKVVAVRTASGGRIEADHVVIAAGPSSGRVAALLDIHLPVEPRKRTVFVFRAPLEAPDMPLVFDTSGIWVRPESGGFIAGATKDEANDPRADGDFEPDMAELEDLLWEPLAHRIPAFERLRVSSAWAGHYEVNTLDHNGVIGPHHELGNLLFATGFSGHGVQHAPAAGRGIAELVRSGQYETLDLTPLGYARIRDNKPMPELVVF